MFRIKLNDVIDGVQGIGEVIQPDTAGCVTKYGALCFLGNMQGVLLVGLVVEHTNDEYSSFVIRNTPVGCSSCCGSDRVWTFTVPQVGKCGRFRIKRFAKHAVDVYRASFGS